MLPDALRPFTNLTVLTFLPALGAIVLMLLRITLPRQKGLARATALFFSLLTMAQSILIFYTYASGQCPAGNSFTARS